MKLFFPLLSKAGEHSLQLKCPDVKLEGVLLVPENLSTNLIAFLGHPHSLQGGTMNNKVVTTLARALKEKGIPSLRFNFRGVGQSEGQYDDGLGESRDMLFLVDKWREELPESEFIFAGFSFGSYVTYRAASHRSNRLLLSIAPPVHHYNYKAYKHVPNPWHIIQGEEDEVVEAALVHQFAGEAKPKLPVHCFPETGHFFHGKLVALKTTILDILQQERLGE